MQIPNGLQARGGLKPSTRRFLDKVAEEVSAGKQISAAPPTLKLGTRLMREWHGVKEICNKPDMIMQLIERVELRQDGILLKLSLASLVPGNTPVIITRDISMQMKRRGVEMRLVVGGNGPARMDMTMIKTVACAHQWFQDLLSGRVQSITEIASRAGIDRGDVNKRLPLAFLAPDIIEAIITGQQPADLLTEKLVRRIDLPLDWVEQSCILGFA